MAFQVSPGVQINEIDLTNVVPSVSASIGGYVGAFNWGPVEEVRTVSSEKELASVFGTPTDETARSFFTAASYLKYSSNLKAVRAVAAAARNATSGHNGTSGVLIKNRERYDSIAADGQLELGVFAAKCPGVLGNSISVQICGASSAVFNAWGFASNFSTAPSTSSWATKAGASNDELHIIVIDRLGKWTGIVGAVLEKFEYVSQASDAQKADGTSNYYKNVVNTNSNFIWWLDHPAAANSATLSLPNAGANSYALNGAYATGSAPFVYTLAGGVDANVLAAGDITGVITSIFSDAATQDVNLLFAVPDLNGGILIANALVATADLRKDCMVFLSPAIEDTVVVGSVPPLDNVKAWADAINSTSYAVLDSTAVKVYDKYNDVFRWIPACGFVAGLCANVDQAADAWFSPAGLNRGQLLGITKIAFNPKQADRDTLYKARVNPIVSFPGQGTILYGDKTALAKPSAFDRIGVRRLFITLEKAISAASKYQLFEFNDEFTRAMFRNMVEPFLRTVQGRRGITDFRVVCDSSNNTADIIDRNEFVAEIYIKPARSINYITLNFIATRTGVEFSELSAPSAAAPATIS